MGSIGGVIAGLVIGLLIGWCLLILLGSMFPELPLPLPTSTVTSIGTVTKTVTSLSFSTITSTVTSIAPTTVTVYETVIPPAETITVTETSIVEHTVTSTVTSTVSTTVTSTATITMSKTVTVVASEGLLPQTLRCFDLYVFEEGYWVRVCTSIVGLNTSIAKPLPLYRGSEEATIEMLVDEGAREPAIRDLASKLWELAGGDVELFTHYVAWSLYQLTYNETRATLSGGSIQHPIYTLYSGSGICIDYAVLYSSILKAIGVDHIVILANVTGQGLVNVPHVLVGVKIPSGVKLPYKYHGFLVDRDYRLNASIEYNGETYYLVDPTPSPVLFVEDTCSLSPPTIVYPAFVGEIPWDEIRVIKIVEVKG